MNKRILLPVVLLMLACNDLGLAQTNDAGMWLSVNVEKKLNPVWALQFSEELRLNENYTEVGTLFSDVGLSYKFNGNFKVSANYRFTNSRRLDNIYDNRHRYYFDLNYRYKMKPLVFAVRGRWQSQYVDVFSSPDGKISENYFRPKIEVKWDPDKKMLPFLSAEAFIATGIRKNNTGLGCMRYTAGTQFAFSARSNIEIFYMIQQEMNGKNPETDFILGIGYSFKF